MSPWLEERVAGKVWRCVATDDGGSAAAMAHLRRPGAALGGQQGPPGGGKASRGVESSLCDSQWWIVVGAELWPAQLVDGGGAAAGVEERRQWLGRCDRCRGSSTR